MTITMTSIAKRLDAGTYLPHRAPAVGARSAPLRAHATPSATPIEDTISGAILGALAGTLAGTALAILAALTVHG